MLNFHEVLYLIMNIDLKLLLSVGKPSNRTDQGFHWHLERQKMHTTFNQNLNSQKSFKKSSITPF